MQTTSHLLMIRPVAFTFNEETAVNNTFQHKTPHNNINKKAQEEFDFFVKTLRQNKIDVTVIEDSPLPHTPDAIFPNNWASYHSEGQVVIYPMFASNRRKERAKNIIEKLSEKFVIHATIDLTAYEKENKFLEGTGSMILDRENQLAYACKSPRTNATVLYDFCETLGYNAILFAAKNEQGIDIYHTNVIMSIASNYVVICWDAIETNFQKELLATKFADTGKEVIPITFAQMKHFAGNLLQVKNKDNVLFLIMSTQAYQSFTKDQLTKISSFNEIIHVPLTTIELNGGGGARCMIAEVFLQQKIPTK